MDRQLKLCFVVSEDWYFRSHRLPLAEEAIRRGWEVCLIARMGRCAEELQAAGIRTVHVEIDRGGLNIFKDLRYSRKLAAIYRKEKPDIIHHVAMKPCLFGSIAAVLSGRRGCMVNAIAGLGSLFSGESRKMRLVRPLVRVAFKSFLGWGNSKLILQNMDDFEELEKRVGFASDQLRLIRGSGVDMNEFKPSEAPRKNDKPLIVLVSRLLIEKGIPELIEAAGILKQRGVSCRVALVGEADDGNPRSVSAATLTEAEKRGEVECWGRRSDIAEIYRQADIAVLPSYYREGIPKTLLEAAAAGLPIVTTDSVGCREVVDDGVNGFLIPIKQAEPLADALEKLINDPALRMAMGEQSRKKACAEFDINRVVEQTFDIYAELLGTGD